MRKKHIVSRDGKLSKDNLTKLMENYPSEIVFTKKDGSRRVMKCSLNYDLMPKKEKTEGEESKPKSNVSDSNIMVISLDKETPQWRSIKLESIISVVVE